MTAKVIGCAPTLSVPATVDTPLRELEQFVPPPGLRNGHLQTCLGSLAVGRLVDQDELTQLIARSERKLYSTQDGISLEGWLSQPDVADPRTKIAILHGWEGCAESNYVLEMARIFDTPDRQILRLNFRDHGDSHALNEGIFHSCRLDEVHAVLEQFFAGTSPGALIGFSLGGNFALRCGIRGIDRLQKIVAINPVIDPGDTLLAIESHPIYNQYFSRKWRRSLDKKRALFPQLYERPWPAGKLRELTSHLVDRYTDFGELEEYFDGYALYGDRLAHLEIPATIVSARDDPIVRIERLEETRRARRTQTIITRYGGHCGYLSSWKMESLLPRVTASIVQRYL